MTTIPLEVDLRPDSMWVANANGRGGRSVKAWQAHLGPFGGYARSQADAKANLASAITLFAEDYRRPEFMEFHGLTAVVWCEPHDIDGIVWCSKVIGGNGYTGSSVTKTRRDAVSSARWHLADAVAHIDVYDEATIELAAAMLDEGEPDSFGHTGRDLRRYCAWQRAHRWADAHVPGVDPHRWAGEHQDEFLDRFDRPEAA